ncbi:MAG: hypothetical protein J6T02_02090 [Bacteroidales bacterium]|nr:hypothetical protein [Bacteroidales bacterium]
MEIEKSRQEIIDEVKLFLQKDYGKSKARKQLPRCIDIHCEKDGKDTYFCVMAVSFNKKTGKYFDATVSSEWEFLRGEEGNRKDVKFVIYCKDIEDEKKRIKVLSPDQVLSFSVPHLTSFQIKFEIGKEDLENPARLNGEKGSTFNDLNNALDKFNAIKKDFNM